MSENIHSNNSNVIPENHPDNIIAFQPTNKSPLGEFSSQEELDQFIAEELLIGNDPDHFVFPTMYELHKLAMWLHEGFGVEDPEEATHRVMKKLSNNSCSDSEWNDDPELAALSQGELEYSYPADDDPFDYYADDCESGKEKMSADTTTELFNDPDDGKPPMYCLSEFRDTLPELADELIQGILRVGHKMLIAGPSKAGKTFLLMYLAIAIAEGIDWLKFRCKSGKVLYINLEIDAASAIHRMYAIYEALGIQPKNDGNIAIWNLRGHAEPMDQLVPTILRRLRNKNFDAIIIDPIYKVIMGDENTATDMGRFCNEFDKLCTELGCSVIMCHHHSKGAQGGKKSMDRSSGSGVFARDPDAILDIVELSIPDELRDVINDPNVTAWRMESTLREFANIKPVNILFQYPLHKVDETDLLEGVYPEGSPRNNLSKSCKNTTHKERRESIFNAYTALEGAGPVKIKDMALYLKVSEGTIRNRINEMDEFGYKNGVVYKKKSDDGRIVPGSDPQAAD